MSTIFTITKKLFSVLMFSLILSANAQAELFTYTEGYAPDGNISFGPNETGFIAVLGSQDLSALPQFDPSLGTLQSVTLSINGFLFWDTSIEGFDVVDDNTSNEATADYSVGMGIGAPINGTFSLTTYEEIPDTADCFAPAGAGGCLGSFFGQGADIDVSETFTGSGMTDFIGLGDLGDAEVQLLAGLESPMTLDNLNNAALYIDYMGFDGNVTVQYETSAVPVPAAVWLFGSGLIGLLGLRKKRQ